MTNATLSVRASSETTTLAQELGSRAFFSRAYDAPMGSLPEDSVLKECLGSLWEQSPEIAAILASELVKGGSQVGADFINSNFNIRLVLGQIEMFGLLYEEHYITVDVDAALTIFGELLDDGCSEAEYWYRAAFQRVTWYSNEDRLSFPPM